MPFSNRDRHRACGRRNAPALEPLETRDLPAHAFLHPPAAPVGLTAVDQGGLQTAPPPDSSGGLPTAHEVARQRYVGRFKGSYVLGPGRYTDQALSLSSKGYGGSNQALHLYANLLVTVPTDPAAAVTGVLYMPDWTVATTGTALVLDLTGDRSTAVNGVPTHYTWTVDPSSGGVYQNVGGYGGGQGTMDVQFFRPGRGPRGSLAGQLQFAVNGFVNKAGGGISNPIGVLGNAGGRF